MSSKSSNRTRVVTYNSDEQPNSLATLPATELINIRGGGLTPPILARLTAAANQVSAEYHGDRRLIWIDGFQPVVNYLNAAKALVKSDEIFLDGPSGGLVRVRDEALERIAKGKDLAAVLSDLVEVQYLTDGKVSTAVPASKLDITLRSNVFREQFPVLDGLTTVPAFASDWTLLRPGYNGDLAEGFRYFFAGQEPRVERKVKHLPRFLDALQFESESDRTNAFVSGISPYLRLLYPGRLPVNLYLSKRSFGGKGTLFEATFGLCPRVKINLEAADWANKKNVAIAINADPTTVVVLVDNVDISLRSAFIESLVTDARQAIHCTGSGDPVGRPYRLVVVVTMNVADVSLDILHRSIPVMLSPVGNTWDRTTTIGDPKTYAQEHAADFQAEYLGAILNWAEKCGELDESVRHNFAAFAATAGGIAKFSGFQGFLGNYGLRVDSSDPVRRALARLAYHWPDKWEISAVWLAHAKELGLVEDLVRKQDRKGDVRMSESLDHRLYDARESVFLYRSADGLTEFKLDFAPPDESDLARLRRFQFTKGETTALPT